MMINRFSRAIVPLLNPQMVAGGAESLRTYLDVIFVGILFFV